MEGGSIGFIILILVLIIPTGVIIWDNTIAESTTVVKTIIPVSVKPTSDERGNVMDECFNTYDIYTGNGGIHPFGKKDSDIKLMYCKENHIPCEITLVDHIFYKNGIASVSIVNSTTPPTCNK